MKPRFEPGVLVSEPGLPQPGNLDSSGAQCSLAAMPAECTRETVRFILREMSDEHWAGFRALLDRHLGQPRSSDDLGVLEVVFRLGESVTNVEIAAQALADKHSGRRLLQPEVARRNALARVPAAGALRMDPQAAYLEAKAALEQAQQTASRAGHTLACQYVQPTASYKHARNTVFRVIDAILESPELMAEAGRIEGELLGIGPVSRGRMRWALHRMPMGDRMKVIRLIPLNTILMCCEPEQGGAGQEARVRATRDRRLAYDWFVRGRSDKELAAAYGLSANAVKNEVGVILRTLSAKPLARKLALEYLRRVEPVQSMGIDEVRSRMKQLSPEGRCRILNGIPNCAWKARGAIHLHKHLFLDYLSGEWVLAALVDYYNLEKGKRIAGKFRFDGNLTVRGANAAIAGMLAKIAGEPGLTRQLRQWTSAEPGAEPSPAEDEMEPDPEELMPLCTGL